MYKLMDHQSPVPSRKTSFLPLTAICLRDGRTCPACAEGSTLRPGSLFPAVQFVERFCQLSSRCFNTQPTDGHRHSDYVHLVNL